MCKTAVVRPLCAKPSCTECPVTQEQQRDDCYNQNQDVDDRFNRFGEKLKKHFDYRMVTGTERGACGSKNNPNNGCRLDLLDPCKGASRI